MAAADAPLIGLALLVIGVPFVLPIAALMFAAAFFPFVGILATGAVGVLVGFATLGPTGAVIVAVVFLVVQQIENNLLYP